MGKIDEFRKRNEQRLADQREREERSQNRENQIKKALEDARQALIGLRPLWQSLLQQVSAAGAQVKADQEVFAELKLPPDVANLVGGWVPQLVCIYEKTSRSKR